MGKHIVAAFAVLIILSPAPAEGRKSNSRRSNIREIDLPGDYALDMELAISGRAKIMGRSEPLNDPQLTETGKEVFNSLVGNGAISGLGLPYKWSLTFLGNDVVNAASTAGGQIYVDGGLAKLIGSNRGLWAAVLSHEIAHTALRHQVRMYLESVYIAQQIQYFRVRAAYGDKAANWTLLGLQIAGPLLLKKMGRDQENQADVQGMMLMARAGYHPDNIFALHHLLEMKSGEQSKFGAFFSDHPRWATRDQRAERAYADALGEFTRAWPDEAAAPGGIAPLVAFLDPPRAMENKQSRSADISVPVYCRNSSGPITLLLQFTHDNSPVMATKSDFADSSGRLQVKTLTECTDKDQSGPVSIALPASAVPRQDRKIKARVTAIDSSGTPLDQTKEFEVHVPKP